MQPPVTHGPVLRPGARLAPLRHAFTLVEMLVVVALIGILATIVGLGLKGGAQGKSLDAAQRGLMGMIRAAQAAAQLHNTRARMIVFADIQNWQQSTSGGANAVNAKILRFYGVVWAYSDDPNLPTDPETHTRPYTTWTAFNDGALLPDGIYFVPSKESGFCIDVPSFATAHNALSTDFTYTAPTALDDHTGTVTGLMQIYFPLNNPVQEGQGDWWYFIEFAPDGYYYNANNNDNIIIGAGTPLPNGYSMSFRTTGDTPNQMYSGAQMRAIGGAAPVRTSDDFSTDGATSQ